MYFVFNSITSYDCLSMDKYFGMIEVVCGAKTVCDIEMHKQEGVMATTSMHEWLYTVSEGGERYYYRLIFVQI